jgi:hypothetical protein
VEIAAEMQGAKKPETRNLKPETRIPNPDTRKQEAKAEEIRLFTTGPLAGK